LKLQGALVLKRSLSVLLLAGFIAGCSDDSAPLEPLRELPYAVATPSCGPADGPAVLIYLASMPIEALQPVAPFVQVNILRSITELDAGSVIQISESISDANAWFRGSGVERQATGGEVGVTSRTTDTLAGYIDLRFTDGAPLRGSFAATWTPRQLLCG
jgi:hypothetical protein